MISLLSAMLLIGVFLQRPQQSESVVMQAEYKRAVISNNEYSATVMCIANAPLAACQFRVQDQDGGDFETIDMSKGSASGNIQVLQRDSDSTAFRAQYHGKGLDNRQCGMKIKGSSLAFRSFIVSCRGRGFKGGWAYDTISLDREVKNKIQVVRQPNRHVYQPGEKVTVDCNIPIPASYCRFAFSPDIDTNSIDTGTARDQYKYHGAGVKKGNCGITLLSVMEKNNGVMKCEVGRAYEKEITMSYAIVAKAPTAPKLTLSADTLTAKENTLKATCKVRGGRPAPTITWLLGDRQIRTGSEDDKIHNTWRWPWQTQDITQTISISVNANDNGKQLVCQVKHFALAKPKKSSKTIHVNPN